jgi:hypothetical protein
MFVTKAWLLWSIEPPHAPVCNRRHDRRGGVRTAVADHEQFEVRECLREAGANRERQHVRAVVSRKEDAD